ncbi:hypothetical protein POM88_038356 [Heracleum sosnowskyi]|uniref:Lipoxygenase domain-containing protein n=1 Tax=Heracleum sosnowskyi TaxID=360622 RepID=A0AAD8H8D6_9APIA|nr:hypothetical protein POM88_038356 [Heracleum sosnowskyi]
MSNVDSFADKFGRNVVLQLVSTQVDLRTGTRKKIKETVLRDCSWVQSNADLPGKRIFFSNQPYLPNETPAGLRALRQKELRDLRGDVKGVRKLSDRIYDCLAWRLKRKRRLRAAAVEASGKEKESGKSSFSLAGCETMG